MKFSLLRDAQGRTSKSPITLDVTKEARSEYSHSCPCTEVYRVTDIQPLIDQRLALATQTGPVFVCDCLGAVIGTSPTVAQEPFPDLLRRFKGAWRPSEHIGFSEDGMAKDGPFERDLATLITAHAEHVRTDGGWREHPGQHALDCAIQLDGKSCDCGLPTLKLERPLAVLDLETTDAEPTTCAIFQFGVTVMMPDGSRKYWDKTFKPWTPITPEAEEVTGTTNAMVESCPPFSQFAAQILNGLAGKDLAGFNLKSFDLICLDEELRRCGLRLNLQDVTVIDAFHLFQRKDPRDLTAAVKKFCGRDHVNAHGALADSQATADVIEGLLAAYPDLADMSLADLDKFSMRDPERQIADLAGKFYRDSDGDLRYTLAKVRDVKVRDDPGFGRWMLKQNNPPFPGSTREVLLAELERIEAGIRQRYVPSIDQAG